MISDILATLSHERCKAITPPKLEVRVDGMKSFIAALEAEHGPMRMDAKAPSFDGIPIVEDRFVPPGMALITQDGFVVDIIRYAPEEQT